MQLHGNARTTPYIRREMVRRVRERAEPVTDLGYSRTPPAETRSVDSQSILCSTVSAWLKRLGLAKLDALEPKPEIVRYEYEHPGDLLHLDTKKLARIRPTWTPHPRRPAPSGPTASAGRTPTSLSTITLGWRTSKAARRRPTHLHSVPAASRRALRFDGSSGAPSVTDNPTSRSASIAYAINSRGTFTPGPTPPEPTAKPNASSAHSRSSGPTHLLPDLSSTYSSSTALAQPLQSSPSPRRHRHEDRRLSGVSS